MPTAPASRGLAEGNEPQESEQNWACRTSSGGSEEPSPPVSSGVAAPRFSACPVEQRRVRVSEAGEEKGQGIACTNSP